MHHSYDYDYFILKYTWQYAQYHAVIDASNLKRPSLKQSKFGLLFFKFCSRSYLYVLHLLPGPAWPLSGPRTGDSGWVVVIAVAELNDRKGCRSKHNHSFTLSHRPPYFPDHTEKASLASQHAVHVGQRLRLVKLGQRFVAAGRGEGRAEEESVCERHGREQTGASCVHANACCCYGLPRSSAARTSHADVGDGESIRAQELPPILQRVVQQSQPRDVPAPRGAWGRPGSTWACSMFS